MASAVWLRAGVRLMQSGDRSGIRPIANGSESVAIGSCSGVPRRLPEQPSNGADMGTATAVATDIDIDELVRANMGLVGHLVREAMTNP